jgi:hypothetical protein
VKRVAGNPAAILSTSSPPEPSANVRSKEPLYSSHSQLFSLDKVSFLAALSESPNPVKIISDCSARKVAFSPYSNDLALARVDYLHSSIHEVLDDVTQKKFDGLSRQPCIILAFWWALHGKALDNTGLGIMRPTARVHHVRPAHGIVNGISIALQKTIEIP